MQNSEPYSIVGTDIRYDAGLYRAHIQDVKEAIGEVGKLSNANSEQVRRVLETIIRSVYLATRQLYDPLVDKEKMDVAKAKRSDYLTDLKDLEKKCREGSFLD